MASIEKLYFSPPPRGDWWNRPPAQPMGWCAEYGELLATCLAGKRFTENDLTRAHDLARELNCSFDRDLTAARQIRRYEQEFGGRFGRVEDAPGWSEREANRADLQSKSANAGDYFGTQSRQLGIESENARARFAAYLEWASGPYGSRLIHNGAI